MKWSKRASWACAALGLVTACGKPPLTPPSQGGNGWTELNSAQFRLVSDLNEQDAGKVIANLEETYRLLGSAVFKDAAVPSFRTNALIFRSPTDLRQFVGDGVGGQYLAWLHNDLEPAPTVLAWGSLSPFARLLFAHELTHRFNHVALGTTPPWLNEGLADYYSTIRANPDGDAHEPITGEIDPRYMCTPDGLGDLMCYQYERIARSRLPRASQIIEFDRQAFYADTKDERGVIPWEQKRQRTSHYAVSWLLVHLLMHADLPYAERFRRVLAEPPSTGKGRDLAQVVSSVPARVLDQDFDAYLAKRIPWRQHHARQPPLPNGLERRTLSDGEVLVWWARLDPFRGPAAGRAKRHLQQATQLAGEGDGAPWFWLGRYAALRQQPEDAETKYRRALEIEPGNPSYLYGLLVLYWGDREGQKWEAAARSPQVAETVAALARTATSASQLNAVAAHQLFSKDLDAALASSEAACLAASDCWPCFHNRAAALFASGDAAEAARTQAQALDRLPEGAPQAMADVLSQALAYYLAASADTDSVAGRPAPGLFAP